MNISFKNNWFLGFRLAIIYQAILTGLVLLLLLWRYGSADMGNLLQSRFGAWDADHYITIARNGYQIFGDEHNFIVFYPLFPALIFLTSKLLFLPLYPSAFILTTICSIVGHGAFYVFLKERGYDERRVKKIMLLLFASPASIYFTHLYNESLYLMLSSLFLVFLYRKHKLQSSLAGFLAATTRITGSLMLIPYIIKTVRDNKKIDLKQLIIGLLIPIGFLLYSALNLGLHDDAFYWMKVQEFHFNEHAENPITQYMKYLSGAKLEDYKTLTNQQFPTITIDSGLTLVILPILVIYILKRKKRLPIELYLWSVAQYLLILSQSFWRSNTRYLMLILPLYIILEELTQKSKFIYFLILSLSLVICLFSIDSFVYGKWLF